MDHSGMDHGHLGHGDMDMGDDQCSMNVGFADTHEETPLICLDALHLVIEEPMYHIPTMARHWHILASHLPGRYRSAHGRLRGSARY
jgi:hypothetical protein